MIAGPDLRSMSEFDPLKAVRLTVNSGRFREAWHQLERLPEDVRNTPEWQLLAAKTSWRLGDFNRSRIAAVKARDVYRTVGDADGEMRSENVAAAGSFAIGDLDEAHRGFSRAFQLAQARGDDLTTARCANNLGNVAFYRGRYEEALRLYSISATTYEKIRSDLGMAITWHNRGIVLRDMNRLTPAKHATDEALRAAQAARDNRLTAQALCGLGETNARLGDTRIARVQVQHALDMAFGEEDRLTEIEALRVLCMIDRFDGGTESALTNIEKAVTLAREIKHPWMLAVAQQEMGELMLKRDQKANACRAFEEAARTFNELGSSKRAREMRARAQELT